MGLIFILSWTAQFIAGRSSYNAGQLADLQAPLSWSEYLAAPDFWNRTLQNWQSELLAVGSMVVFSVYLRERGSPESKPVNPALGDRHRELKALRLALDPECSGQHCAAVVRRGLREDRFQMAGRRPVLVTDLAVDTSEEVESSDN